MKKRISLILCLVLVMALAIVPMFALTASAEEETRTYKFADYKAGTQYADNEKHELDNDVTMVTSDAHFTSELRLYSSTTYNGKAVIESSKAIVKIAVNAGNKVDTLNIYGSADGTNWSASPIATIKVTSTSYKDYSADLGGSYNYLMLDVAGTNQVRLKTMTLTFAAGGSDAPACDHSNTTTDTTGATCTEDGEETVTCDDCGHIVSNTKLEATGHNFEDGVCTECGVEKPSNIIFELAPDGEAGHTESTSSSTSYTETVSGYTLHLTNGVKFFLSCKDEKGNGAIKLGTGSAAGEFDFKVPDDVTSVIIHIAGYKSNAAKVSVNGTTYDIVGKSVDGKYDAIVVDTTQNKTITVTTLSGGYRAMVNTIEFVLPKGDADCDHNYVPEVFEATCSTAGYTKYTCSKCPDNYTEAGAPATGIHTGIDDYKCDECKKIILPADGEAFDFVTADKIAQLFASNTYSENKYYITGVITGFYGDNALKFGNVWIEDNNGNKFLVYGLYSFDGSTRYDSMTYKPVVGDEITVYGVLGTFNGTSQMKSGWLDEVIAHEHDYNDGEVTKAPTCTEAGEKTLTCTICSGTKVEAVDATGHNYDAVVTKPTCENGGYTTHTCSGCGDSYVDTYTDAKGHRYSNVQVTPATCTVDGYLTVGCGDCGKVWDSRYDDEAKQYLANSPWYKVNATGHKYDAVVTKPTCENGGYTTHTCSGCGDSYVDTYTDAKGHRFSSVVITSATCTENGYITLGCGDCGKVWDSRYDDVAKQYLIDNPYFNLSAKGHSYDAVVTKPTCENGGYTTHTCSGCGDSYVDTYTDAKGHRFSSVDITSATCTENGYITLGCGDCGKVWDSRYDDVAKQYLIDNPYFNLSAKGHNYGENGSCTNKDCDAFIAKIDGASVNVGADLGVKWFVKLPEGASIEDFVFVISMNDRTYELAGKLQADGRYMFFFQNIAPQQMGDLMTATITKVGETDPVATIADYSVKTYLLKKINDENSTAELVTLCVDLLNYGAAAQQYMNYKTDDLVNAGLTASGTEVTAPKAELALDNNKAANGFYFKSASVFFASTNKIVVKLVATENTTLTINGVEYALVEGENVIYTDAISAIDLGDRLVFVLTDGEVTTTLEYSVLDYAAAKYDADGAMGDLAKALCAYAQSAAAYNS